MEKIRKMGLLNDNYYAIKLNREELDYIFDKANILINKNKNEIVDYLNNQDYLLEYIEMFLIITKLPITAFYTVENIKEREKIILGFIYQIFYDLDKTKKEYILKEWCEKVNTKLITKASVMYSLRTLDCNEVPNSIRNEFLLLDKNFKMCELSFVNQYIKRKENDGINKNEIYRVKVYNNKSIITSVMIILMEEQKILIYDTLINDEKEIKFSTITECNCRISNEKSVTEIYTNDKQYLKLKIEINFINNDYKKQFNVLYEKLSKIVPIKKEVIKSRAKNKESIELNNNNTNVFEEIRKYKQLYDEGIITEEEFKLKKKKLMDI